MIANLAKKPVVFQLNGAGDFLQAHMNEPAHILVVDDDPSIRRMLELLFKNAGYRVSAAASGEEALAYVELVRPDLVITDWRMPGITGEELTRQIKHHPDLPFVPVIMLTAQMDNKSKLTGFDAGADDYLVKPVNLDELLARARVMLRLQRSQRELRAEQQKTELLLNLSRALNRSINLDELLPHFLQQLTTAIQSNRACVLLTSLQPMRFYSSTGFQPLLSIETLLNDSLAGWVLRQRTAAIIRDTDDDNRWKPSPLATDATRSALALPLVREGRHLGVMTIVHHTPNYFTPTHLELCESVAGQLAIAVQHAELFYQIENERQTLTTVVNGTQDPILLISPDHRLLLSNTASQERLNLNGHEQHAIREIVNNPKLQHLLHTANTDPHAAPPEIEVGDETFHFNMTTVYGAQQAIIGRVAVLHNITALKELERQEQARLRTDFERYMSPQVVERVLAGGTSLDQPVERDLVVLFADIRGYTALVEGLPPQVVVHQVLNRHFSAMTKVVHNYEGTIDKFLGDGLIAVFGTPLTQTDDSFRAVAAAVAMQQAFQELSTEWEKELGIQISLGIGMSFGTAVVGNIGSQQRLDYTIIGDVVNTASRLCSMAKGGQILASANVIQQFPPNSQPAWYLELLPPIQLRGKHDYQQVYDIRAARGEIGNDKAVAV
jgi:class 3 adenylate cyclase/DNA-binding response OmpR family regulator